MPRKPVDEEIVDANADIEALAEAEKVDEAANGNNDDAYVNFECDIISKGANYIDVKYSRNDEDGVLDTTHYAVSRFFDHDIDGFTSVPDSGTAVVRILNGSLTDELVKYADQKVSVDDPDHDRA